MATSSESDHTAHASLRHVERDMSWFGVLVVDDDATIRTALAALLADEGYTTRQAGDGAEALDILRGSEKPYVVLLDWMMPHLDGITLLHLVAADADLARHQAFIFTSAAFPSGLRQVAALPRTIQVDVLVKPFTITVLLTKVEQAIARLAVTHYGADASRDQQA